MRWRWRSTMSRPRLSAAICSVWRIRTIIEQHVARGRELKEAYHHPGNVLDVQLRGEYLYAALGKGGFRAYDVANIDNKGFSERTVTAPVSPLGQQLYVKTKYAMAVASPSTLAIDPARTHKPENEEQADSSDVRVLVRCGQVRRAGGHRRFESE